MSDVPDPGAPGPPPGTWIDPPGGWSAPPPDPWTVHPLASTPLEGHESNGSTPTGSSRRRRRTVAVVAVICVVALGAAGVAVGVAASPGSSGPTQASSSNAATRLLGQAVAATTAAGTFHYVAVAQGGNTNQTTVGAAGRDSGTQRITFDSAAFGTEHFSLVLVSGVVYFEGNAAAIQDQLAVTSRAAAAAHAGRWIALQHSDRPYAALAEGITARSALTQIVIRPHTVSAVRSADGRRIWRLSGGLPPVQGQAVQGTAHLDIAATTKLPLSYASTTSTGGEQGTSGFTFSRWGSPVTVTAPSSSIPYSSISPSSGTGGSGPTFST